MTALRDQVESLIATVRNGLQLEDAAAASALDSLADVTLVLDEARALTAEARLADCESSSSRTCN